MATESVPVVFATAVQIIVLENTREEKLCLQDRLLNIICFMFCSFATASNVCSVHAGLFGDKRFDLY